MRGFRAGGFGGCLRMGNKVEVRVFIGFLGEVVRK